MYYGCLFIHFEACPHLFYKISTSTTLQNRPVVCSKEEIKSYRFISTWGLISNDNILIFEDKKHKSWKCYQSLYWKQMHFALFFPFFSLSFNLSLFFFFFCQQMPKFGTDFSKSFNRSIRKPLSQRNKSESQKQREGMGFPERPQGEEKKQQKRWV